MAHPMRSSPLIILLSLAANALAADDLAIQALRVNERLSAYHRADPLPSERKLRFAYFLPNDRQPAPDYRERLTRVLDETAAFYEKQIEGYGLKAQPMALDRDSDGLLHFVIVNGSEPWTAYNSKQPFAGRKVREECEPVLRAAGIDPERETIAVFTAIMEWDEGARRFRQKSPYQGGGSARAGFCWQIDSPPLDPRHLPEKTPVIDDGEYGMVSIGKWNSLFVGGVIHELGHALGLPHNAQRPAQFSRLGHSLMGSGNRTFGDDRRGEGPGSFLTFTDAVRLVSHPLFSGSMKGLWDKSAGAAEFDDLRMENDGGALAVSGRVQSPVPVYAVIAYTDGEGGSDYDAIATTAVPDKEGRFQIRCDDLPKGKRVALRLTAMQVNGLFTTRAGFDFTVSNDGNLELEEIRQQLVLAPILAALRVGQSGKAATLTTALPDTEPARRLAAPMLSPPDTRAAASDAKEISLCDLRPTAASVGWRKPAFDYSPEDLIIRVAGRTERRGIYAHAPSSYLWNLDGSWKSIHANCALHDEHDGTVEFIVKADGVEKWRSGIIKKGGNKLCDMDLAGVKSLELIVTNGGDDMHQDHAFWIAPVLKR